jgi:hypothetical protein
MVMDPPADRPVPAPVVRDFGLLQPAAAVKTTTAATTNFLRFGITHPFAPL